MKEIIAPISKKLLAKELTDTKFLRKTNKRNNEIYCFTYHDSPNLTKEVGRLREISFRRAGGGTGKEFDLDAYDISPNPYHQLIVWDPEIKEILGGYRYIICNEAEKNTTSELMLATNQLFYFSEKFKQEYLPYTIELGRSFVLPEYQPKRIDRKGIFVLDNLWDGLGALTITYPEMKYFFGKVTMYSRFNKEARNYLFYFLYKYFSDTDKLVSPHEKYELKFDFNKEKIVSFFTGKNYAEDYKLLSKKIREIGENIPPLINAYMNLSPSLKIFGTAINKNFGDVEETCILININDIHETKKSRHVSTFIPNLKFKSSKKGINFLKKK